jgi:hypothetical protein
VQGNFSDRLASLTPRGHQLSPATRGSPSFDVEREMGIEPTSPAWKAGTLPLSYSRDGWSPTTTISEAREKTQSPRAVNTREGPMMQPAGDYARSDRCGWVRKVRLRVTAVPALCRYATRA